METLVTQAVLAGGVAVMSVVVVIQQRIARRGLLFGVYVGEAHGDNGAGARIVRAWHAGVALAALAGLAAGEFLLARTAVPAPLALVVALVLLTLLSTIAYLAAHAAASRLAVASTAPSAATIAPQATPVAWPLAALALAVVAGVGCVAHAAWNVDRMPAVVPIHFGPSGAPDAWSPRSFWAVMLAPLATLLIGTALGLIACLTARAKRAIRHRDQGQSFEAQQRFRHAMSVFLSGASILVTTLMTAVSVYSTRTALGAAAGMPPWMPVLSAALVVYAVGGTLYLALRLGQGGARLERGAGDAPLTNGLADNSRWVLGMFYVNRDDPSLFVEKRFGLGYTINFGNRRAVVLFILFLVVVLGIALRGSLLPQTSIVPR